jgi:hypothetical protein
MAVAQRLEGTSRTLITDNFPAGVRDRPSSRQTGVDAIGVETITDLVKCAADAALIPVTPNAVCCGRAADAPQQVSWLTHYRCVQGNKSILGAGWLTGGTLTLHLRISQSAQSDTENLAEISYKPGIRDDR